MIPASFFPRAVAGLLALSFLTAASAPTAPTAFERAVKPSALDPGVRQFDEPSLVISPKGAAPDAPLALFLTGTGGRPTNVVDLLRTVAGQGYRVVGLEYDDEPAVMQVCPHDPDPECAGKFREMRIDGTGPGGAGVTNPPAESITARLVALIKAFDRAAPGQGWGGYLDGDRPRWDRIVVSGLSQGAGMAAYIAKAHPVRRVVLFSSPWDFTLPGRKLAPWISRPGATPPARWFAEYHKREATADLLAKSYQTLGIPADHVLVFDRDLPRNAPANSANPYHGSTVRDVGYAAEWRKLYGKASDPAD
jgi:hypothetical protein